MGSMEEGGMLEDKPHHEHNETSIVSWVRYICDHDKQNDLQSRSHDQRLV
jgi:hypothetical protein